MQAISTPTPGIENRPHLLFIKEHLQRVAETWDMNRSVSDHRVFTSVEQFVLTMGRAFIPQPLPAGMKFGAMKSCMKNASRIAKKHNLFYVEGYAIPQLFNYPFYHAWCVAPNGSVVDPTWPVARAYFGVALQLDYVFWVRKRTGCLSVIDNPPEFPLLHHSVWDTSGALPAISGEFASEITGGAR